MLKLTEQQIKAIATHLEDGKKKCFYHKLTGKIESFTILNSIDAHDIAKEFVELEGPLEDYVCFDGFETYEAFDLMTDFTRTVAEKALRKNLINALNDRKSFANFNFHITNSEEYHQKWLNFKTEHYIKRVEDQLKAYNGC